jgi:hypothetical protein
LNLLQQQKEKSSNFVYLALLLIIAVVGYWQISFLKYMVTHDMINCWIPWRYYISNCIQNHVFPFWNPYQQLGYPIHADLQGPTWYLESLLLSITTGQDNIVVQLLFIFYVFMAGMGMYFLSLCFQNKKNIAFIVGVSYMLSGFFVAHVQHLYAVIGAAWLPFIILNYYRMHTQKSYLHAVYASVFMFFNLTGGNHTFSIILIYLCLLIFGYFIFISVREKNRSDIFQYIKINALFVVCTLLMATVVIVAYSQTAPYIDRLSGLTYKNASIFKFSPQSLLSFVLPFSTVNGMDFYETDPSMCNAYFGILMLVFSLLALISKKTGLEKLLLIFAFLCLLASFGPDTPFHKLIFDSLPLINLFRNPSYFSLFTILILLLIGGKKLSELSEALVFNRKKLVGVTVFIAAIILISILIALAKDQNESFFFFKSYANIFDFIKASSFYQNIVLQGTIQLIFLAAFIITISSSLKKHWLKITVVLICLNLIISTQLNIALVGFSSASPKELKEYITTLPQDFPIPDTAKIVNNTEALGQKHGLYLNTSLFHKRISASVFNSYAFKNQIMLLDSFPVLYKSMLSNPLCYFSEQIHSNSEISKMYPESINNKTIVFSDSDFQNVSGQIDKNSVDTVEGGIIIDSFNPNRISLKANASKTQILTLLQSDYVGWEALIDNKTVPIMLSNYLTMSVVFPKGNHEVIFQYKNPKIIYAGIISYASFLIILGVLSFVWIRKYKNYIAPIVIWLVLISAVGYYLF